MKIKLLFVIAVLAAVFTMSTLSFRSGDYKPRTASKIDEVLSYQRPGGKIAAGMSEYFNALRNNPLTGTVSEAEYMAALNATLNMQTKRTVDSRWNELGPDNVGGRIRAFLQDKDTPGLMFAGGVSGGLFRSRSRGSSWVPVNDFQENLNVNSIAQSADGSIIYGTGETDFISQIGGTTTSTAFSGAGMFRSTDRGNTFTKINLTSGFGNINSMASDIKGSNNIVYAGTTGGLRKSIDNGATWTLSKSGTCKEVKVASNGMVVIQSASLIYRSTNQGQTWDDITPPSGPIQRASIAISPEDPNYVYVMISGNDSKLAGVFRSKDAGQTWDKIIASSTSFFDPLISSASSQGYYNNVLTVNPKDKNHIIMGGVFLAEWKDGTNPRYIGSLNDFGGANALYVHSDKHVLQWDMSTNPPTLIIGSDGGISYSSDNLKTFVARNRGFNVTQFYAMAADYEGNIVGGTQDNGTQYINKKGNTERSSFEIKGGDGFQTDISIKNNSIIFAETYYGNITRSRDYGKTQSCMWDRRIAKTFGARLTDTSKYCEFNHVTDWAPFNTKFRLWEHPEYTNTESRLFLARHGQVWMATGATDFQKEPVWYLIASAHGSGQVWDLEPTNDGNSLFISNSSTIYRVDGLNSATYDKWSNQTSIPPGITITNLAFTPGSGRAISSVCLDPNDNNVALITLGNYGFANYIYKASNMLGTPTYTNITSNLPPMPVFDGLIALSNSNLFYVGTEFGVYASDNGGSTWSAQTNPINKFPKVATFSIRQYVFPARNSGSIYAGTHGRGFFECQEYFTNINAVQNSKNSNMMILYPNPSVGDVNVSFDAKGAEDVTFTVMDFTGKTVLIKVVAVLLPGKNQVKLDLSGIKVGTYIVNGTGSNGTNYGTLKLVIRH